MSRWTPQGELYMKSSINAALPGSTSGLAGILVFHGLSLLNGRQVRLRAVSPAGDLSAPSVLFRLPSIGTPDWAKAWFERRTKTRAAIAALRRKSHVLSTESGNSGIEVNWPLHEGSIILAEPSSFDV